MLPQSSVYHLMYLYRSAETDGFHWGHASSRDLLHWRHHPDALTVHEGDRGCYSGGAFVDDDKTAYLSFWKFAATDPAKDRSGIGLACAKPPYIHWERMEPIAVNASAWGVTNMEIDGETVHLACADPSNIWKMNGRYYMQLGNKRVLDLYGREENSPEKYQGAWTDLFRSDDLKSWQYVGRFYDHLHFPNADWPDATEDDMCPSFLPLYDAPEGGNFTGKYLQLFISHNKGCQYFVGVMDGEEFIPQYHGRMTRKNRDFFAPEALVDDRNRHIMWTWMHDYRKDDYDRFGWSGVYSFPRLLWWKNEQLHMAPAPELELLQFNHQQLNDLKEDCVPIHNGERFRLKSVWNMTEGDQAGFRVRVGDDGSHTDIYYDRTAEMLVMDTTQSGGESVAVKEEMPLTLDKDEPLMLDIFVDHSVIEVYANERQAICRDIFPTDPEKATGVSVIGDHHDLTQLDAWELFPSNPD